MKDPYIHSPKARRSHLYTSFIKRTCLKWLLVTKCLPRLHSACQAAAAAACRHMSAAPVGRPDRGTHTSEFAHQITLLLSVRLVNIGAIIVVRSHSKKMSQWHARPVLNWKMTWKTSFCAPGFLLLTHLARHGFLNSSIDLWSEGKQHLR